MNKKFVYLFKEGSANMRELLGGKGANLAEMTNIGLPVPQGFTISTEACTDYHENKKEISQNIEEEILKSLAEIEKINNKKFGDEVNPLLVSVRSGARVSMPGMMDTILNLGLNDKTVVALANLSGNERFAFDSYRRFIQMFASVAMELDIDQFEHILEKAKTDNNIKLDKDLSAEQLKQIVKEYKAKYLELKGEEFPQEPKTQLLLAIKAVFRSWENPRAITYRRLNDIPSSWGTAVNVQTMVFGNLGDTSGTGVAFSRDPSTGENKLYGEYLMNAQGEDIVAGVRTPNPISHLKDQMPEVYQEFVNVVSTLEKHYKDMQDMEFTIENGKLYMLQTRNGKRTAAAALKIAVDLVKEGLLTEQEALLKIEPKSLDALLHKQFDAETLKKSEVIATGLPASPGAGCGKIALSSQKAADMKANKEKCVLVRLETSAEDIEGMHASEGILTGRGGMTSHAAVVARGFGTCCVAGCSGLVIDEKNLTVKIGDKTFKEGDFISLNGSTGNIYEGQLKTVEATLNDDFKTIMDWSKKYKALGVRTNADNPKDATVAYNFGAEGIGLCRTEHMFFEPDRILAMRQMIVAKTVENREIALAKLLPMQKADFVGLFKAMKGFPITIRFLDPPLHEFLPKEKAETEELAKTLNMSVSDLEKIMDDLHEFNPMMGHRGCRLAVTYPEIAKMQTRAVMEAAIEVNKTTDFNIVPEIMIPLVSEVKELKYVKDIVIETANEVLKENNVEMQFKVGTMIEIPRAALTADEIAKEAEFFSFGTNDLTQMTFGFSRDDAGKFLNDYYAKNIYEFDPFARIDFDGVGKLIEMAVKLGKQTRPNLKTGICGEHGGEPSSIEFCHRTGLSYVSCSPYRIPIAILSAAQANIKEPR